MLVPKGHRLIITDTEFKLTVDSKDKKADFEIILELNKCYIKLLQARQKEIKLEG